MIGSVIASNFIFYTWSISDSKHVTISKYFEL